MCYQLTTIYIKKINIKSKFNLFNDLNLWVQKLVN